MSDIDTMILDVPGYPKPNILTVDTYFSKNAPDSTLEKLENVGIDLGKTHLVNLSNGDMIEHFRYYHHAQKVL